MNFLQCDIDKKLASFLQCFCYHFNSLVFLKTFKMCL